MKYLERFEYVCRICEKKGTVLDVLLNPEVLLIRGYCPTCKKRGTYKVVDIEALRQEHEAIAQEESTSALSSEHPRSTKAKTSASVGKAQKNAEVAWKWELIQSGDEEPTKVPGQ